MTYLFTNIVPLSISSCFFFFKNRSEFICLMYSVILHIIKKIPYFLKNIYVNQLNSLTFPSFPVFQIPEYPEFVITNRYVWQFSKWYLTYSCSNPIFLLKKTTAMADHLKKVFSLNSKLFYVLQNGVRSRLNIQNNFFLLA